MQTGIFSKIEMRTVGKEVVNSLRDAIVSGKIGLGTHLAESDLAAQMAVSRIPVREALRQLEQEGLVVRHLNRGCFVTNFSEHDIQEVFSLRSQLEGMAFEWAIPNLGEEDLLILETIIQEQSRAIQGKNYDDLARLDMQFHEFICLKANHHRLLKAWYEQHAQCQILLNLRFRTLAQNTPDTVIEDHRNILQALRDGDASRAIALTQAISSRVSRECIEALQSISQNIPD